MPQRSDLPFGSEFSPSQIDLPELLEIVEVHSGSARALQDAIRFQYFVSHGGGNAGNQNTLAMNCRLGMRAYGIIDEDANLTTFGRELYDARGDESSLYTILARHILLNLRGMVLVQCVQDMTAAGEAVNLTTLPRALVDRGVYYPRGGKHPSIMRLWLAKAGVFVGARWQVDSLRLREVLGTDPANFDTLAHLTDEQRFFLLALANTGISTPQPANELARLATATYGVHFPEKSLPKLVLNALVEAGYITATKTTKGRGAKPFLVAPTDQLAREVIEPLLQQMKSRTDTKLIDLLRKPMAEILADLESQDRHVAGLALEALAFKLMRLIDMSYVATRLRVQATGGAEVDLVFESKRLVFSRWQVQYDRSARS